MVDSGRNQGGAAPDHVTPAVISATASGLFADGPAALRLIQRYRPFICPFHRLLEWVPRGSSVLDVGCGAGLFLGLLAHGGGIGRGFGFDAGLKQVESARLMARRLEGRTPARLVFEHRDVADSWPQESFDVVCLIDVMHHVPVPQRRGLVSKILERVGPTGRFLYKDIGGRPLWRAWANRIHDLAMVQEWVRYQPVEHVEQWCEQQGLMLVHRERIDMCWYGHDLCVFERQGP